MSITEKSSIHNIAFSSEKVISSESGEKYTQIKHCLQVKTVQKSTKQICRWILDGLVHWDGLHWRIIDSKVTVIVKNHLDGFVFLQTCRFSLHKMLPDGLESCELLVDYCDVCHADGTHSLQRIHWWASDVKLNFSKSVPMKKQTHTSWMAWGWVNNQQIFIFGWTIPLCAFV